MSSFSKQPYKYRTTCDCGREILVTIPANPNDRSGERVRCGACGHINYAECQGVIDDE